MKEISVNQIYECVKIYEEEECDGIYIVIEKKKLLMKKMSSLNMDY